MFRPRETALSAARVRVRPLVPVLSRGTGKLRLRGGGDSPACLGLDGGRRGGAEGRAEAGRRRSGLTAEQRAGASGCECVRVRSAMGQIEWAMWANEQALASGLSECAPSGVGRGQHPRRGRPERPGGGSASGPRWFPGRWESPRPARGIEQGWVGAGPGWAPSGVCSGEGHYPLPLVWRRGLSPGWASLGGGGWPTSVGSVGCSGALPEAQGVGWEGASWGELGGHCPDLQGPAAWWGAQKALWDCHLPASHSCNFLFPPSHPRKWQAWGSQPPLEQVAMSRDAGPAGVVSDRAVGTSSHTQPLPQARQ